LKKTLALALISLFMAACGGGADGESVTITIPGNNSPTATPLAATPTMVSTATPTTASATPTELASTPTATTIPTSAATATSKPTTAATVAPTVAATSAPTATNKPAVTATSSPTPTQKPTATTAPTATPTTAPTATKAPTATPVSSNGLVYRGVSLAVAEFGTDGPWGGGTFPGTYGSTYTYPTSQEVDYFVGKGMNTLRLPFSWERLQPTLGGAFNSAEQGYIDTFVNYATGKGAYVVIDPHNYARYNGNNIIGVNGSGVTIAHFADLWTRLATRYKGNSKVIFALMNEPHDMDSTIWLNAANEAIKAIRTTGATNLILVSGNSWSGAHSWESSGNATNMLGIVDSGNNYAFEVHQYLDGDSSGTSENCVSATIGSERLAGFTQWLKANKKRGFLGEFGGGRNSNCYAAIDDQLTHVDNNSDVWIGWTWWAAGPWWGEYIFTIEPTNNFTTDRPQMAYLLKHIPASSTGKKRR